jgi:thiol:disulfide interchange protein DsbD
LLAGAIFFLLPEKPPENISWQPFSEQAFQTARQQGKPMIIDAYADWCIPCKELDKITFSDPGVLGESRRFAVLKLNLTQMDPQSTAAKAKEQFGIQGVPTILFFEDNGQEQRQLRLEGFEKPSQFLARMKQAK